MTRHQQMQKFIRYYKAESGKTEVDMHEVARSANQKGWHLPTPPDPLNLLAREFSQAAREEIRHDKTTGKPYRANHAMIIKQGHDQLTLWIDIDEAPRRPMLKSLIQRREQMVGDAYHLTLDADHWNSIHPTEEPITLPLDFAPDVDWRKHGPEEQVN